MTQIRIYLLRIYLYWTHSIILPVKMKKDKPYHHVRFRWWTRIKLDEISEDFQDEYDVVMKSMIADELEMAIHKDDRNELKVQSDTINAFLSPFRAVLSQKETKALTMRDLELRKKVIELYPRNRPTPLPWLFLPEPAFETANNAS
jgi:hypothetical protein